MIHFNQRQLAGLLIALALVILVHESTVAAEPRVTVKTFVYKTVGDLEIKADVHRANDNVKRPVVVWIHGGALINGHRAGISGRVKKMMLDEGYALVSIDYRLAPETKLPEIIEDLEDAFRWVRKKGPELFDVDASKIAVMGGSAGGYLTLTSGYRAEPRPTVLVAFWDTEIWWATGTASQVPTRGIIASR